jgi:hypothetical protein
MNKYLCIAALLVGCGGGDDSGVSDSTKLGDLSASDSTALCNDFAHDYPARTVDCGDGSTQEVGIDASECGEDEPPPASCEITVGQLRDCFDALYDQSDADVCAFVEPDACMVLDNASGCE